jgi:hypothetical protein
MEEQELRMNSNGRKFQRRNFLRRCAFEREHIYDRTHRTQKQNSQYTFFAILVFLCRDGVMS